MVSMPRRHGKSSLCSLWTPCWFLCRWPDNYVILSSYETDFAELWGRQCRDQLTSWGGMFGVQLKEDSQAAGRWNTTVGGGMVATGAGGALMGRGAHLFIVDDPFKSWEEAQSETIRQKVWDWFQASVLTALEPYGSVVIVMTRWHEDDLVGKVLASSDAAGWKYIRLPALAEAGDPIGRREGEPLWEKRYDRQRLGALKNSLDPRIWAGLYQQSPTVIEGDILKRSWWKFYHPGQLNISALTRVIQSWDCTFKSTKGSDYVVGQVWGQLGPHCYLLDQVRQRMDFPTTAEAIKAMSQRWPQARPILIEESANGYAIIQTLQHELRGILPVKTHGHSKLVRVIGDEEERVHSVSMMIKAGHGWLPDPSTTSWVPGFIDECAAFPAGQFDDQVDALSQALSWLQPSTWVKAESPFDPPKTLEEQRTREFWARVRGWRQPQNEGGSRYDYLNQLQS